MSTKEILPFTVLETRRDLRELQRDIISMVERLGRSSVQRPFLKMAANHIDKALDSLDEAITPGTENNDG